MIAYVTRLVDAAGEVICESFPFGDSVFKHGVWHAPMQPGAVAALLVRHGDGVVLARVAKAGCGLPVAMPEVAS